MSDTEASAGDTGLPVGDDAGRAVVTVRVPRPRKTARRKRIVRWSKKRQAVFLTALGEGCNVSAACRAARLSDTTVYRRRRSDPDFHAGWQEALREGVARLDAEMLNRALNGVEKAVWHGGKQVGTVRHYSDALALALLRMHGPSAGRSAPPTIANRDEHQAEIDAMLAEMNRRMGGDG